MSGTPHPNAANNKFNPSTGGFEPQPLNTTGDHILYTPVDPSNRLRLHGVVVSTPETNTAHQIIKFSIDGGVTYFWHFVMGGSGIPGAFARGTIRESQPGQTLIINLSANQSTFVGFDVEEFT